MLWSRKQTSDSFTEPISCPFLFPRTLTQKGHVCNYSNPLMAGAAKDPGQASLPSKWSVLWV